ncbi:MAG: glutathione S-transferase family protein [Proteobacteria bacterium]|nr:glutathione S-transferase family protein [Pseudomonadota bacterium]
MILVGQYDSPFVRRVAVTLHAYSMAFTRNPLSVFGDFGPLQAINPLRRVPALILDDGEALIDSSAIIDWLDEKAGPRRSLIPREGLERRYILQLVAMAHGTAEKVVTLSLERFLNANKDRNKDWEARLATQITSGLDALEARATNRWLFGEHMSHADVMTGCMIGHLKLRVPELLTTECHPRLHELAARCELNSHFVAARIGANETMPASAT